jgi:hypothetical protein
MKKILLLALVGLFPLMIFAQSVSSTSSSNVTYTTADLSASAISLNSSKTYRILFYYGLSSGSYTASVQSSDFTGVTTNTFTGILSGLNKLELNILLQLLFMR